MADDAYKKDCIYYNEAIAKAYGERYITPTCNWFLVSMAAMPCLYDCPFYVNKSEAIDLGIDAYRKRHGIDIKKKIQKEDIFKLLEHLVLDATVDKSNDAYIYSKAVIDSLSNPVHIDELIDKLVIYGPVDIRNNIFMYLFINNLIRMANGGQPNDNS